MMPSEYREDAVSQVRRINVNQQKTARTRRRIRHETRAPGPSDGVSGFRKHRLTATERTVTSEPQTDAVIYVRDTTRSKTCHPIGQRARKTSR